VSAELITGNGSTSAEDSCDTELVKLVAFLSPFQVHTLLYHLPLYSHASMQNDTLRCSFSLMFIEAFLSSPKTSKTTNLGYCSFVSKTYEQTFHYFSVDANVPSRGSSTFIIVPCISIVTFWCLFLLRDRMGHSML